MPPSRPWARNPRSRPRPPSLDVGALVSLDDAPDDRVADNVGGSEADHADAFDPAQAGDRVDQPAVGVAAGDVDLLRVAADHHAAVLAETGQEHLHLLAGGVLPLV